MIQVLNTNRVLEQYAVLKAYFRETHFEDPSKINTQLKPEITSNLKMLYSNYAKTEYFKTIDVFTLAHKNSKYILPIEQIYIGISAHESIQNSLTDRSCDKYEVELCFKSCLNFNYLIKIPFFYDIIYDLDSVVIPEVAKTYRVKTLLPTSVI